MTATRMEEAIKHALEVAIESRCDCNFTVASIATGEFSCQTTSTEVIYRSAIKTITTHSAQHLSIFAKDWVNSGATVPYDRFRLRVCTDCPFQISSLDEPECLPGVVSRCINYCLARVGMSDRYWIMFSHEYANDNGWHHAIANGWEIFTVKSVLNARLEQSCIIRSLLLFSCHVLQKHGDWVKTSSRLSMPH